MTGDGRRGWVRCYRPRPHARQRLVCLPPAGGGASFYRAWVDDLPDSVELWSVQYPGREDRFDEPCVPDLGTLADRLAAALEPALDRPVALFGHSMGASVAYEVVRRLEARLAGALTRLFVSARPAPRHQRATSAVHRRDDDGLAAELRALGGTPGAVLDDPDLRAALLPMIRNDFRVIETYRPVPHPRLATGIVAFTGDADPRMRVTHAGDWAEVTAGPFHLTVFDGGHFYLVPQRPAVVAEVLRVLDVQEDTVESNSAYTVDGLRAAVAPLLGADPETVGPDDNLIALGLDSIKVMMLASGWQRDGVEVPLGELAAAPTLAGWARLLAARSADAGRATGGQAGS